MKPTITFATAALLFAAGATPAIVQAQQLMRVDMKGTIDEVENGYIKLTCDGKDVYLKVDPRSTQVEGNGTAEASYLKPGVLVRFRSELDKKGVAADEVDKLAIVSPSDTNEPGISSDSIDDGEKRKPKRDDSSQLIVGTVKSIKDGQLVVQAGSKAVRAKLAKDATLTVELDDYTMAEAGDEIHFKGRMAQQQAPDAPVQVVGDEITIKFVKPFAAETKGKSKGKAGKTPSKKKSGGR